MKRIVGLIVTGVLLAAATSPAVAATEVTNGLVASIRWDWVRIIDTRVITPSLTDSIITKESLEQAFVSFRDSALSRQLQVGMRVERVVASKDGQLITLYCSGICPPVQEVGIRFLGANLTEDRNLLEVKMMAGTPNGEESVTIWEIPLPAPLAQGEKWDEVITSIPRDIAEGILTPCPQGNWQFVVRRPDHVMGVSVEVFPIATFSPSSPR